MEENRYYIPFYRGEDYEGKDPAEEKAKVAQLMISALNAYRLVPFAQYQIISEPIDEHSLQELTWNFLWQADVMCAVRDQILADHSNSLFPTDKAVSSTGPLRGVQHMLWIVFANVFHASPAWPRPQASRVKYADPIERDQAKVVQRQLLYEQIVLVVRFASPTDDCHCPPSPKHRARQKKSPKDKDVEDDEKLSPMSAEYAIMIKRMEVRQRCEAAHQRFLRKKAAEASGAVETQKVSGAQEEAVEQGTEGTRPPEDHGPDIMDPDILAKVLEIGNSLNAGSRDRMGGMTPEDEDMLDRDLTDEDGIWDGAPSEEMSIGDEDQVEEEPSGLDEGRLLKVTGESLGFYPNEPSHSSVSPEAELRMDPEVEPVTEKPHDSLHDTPNRTLDRDYPPESPQRTKSRRTTTQRGGSTTADRVGGRRRGGSTEPWTKDRVNIPPKERDDGKAKDSTVKTGKTPIQEGVPPTRKKKPTQQPRVQRVPPETSEVRADPIDTAEVHDNTRGVRTTPKKTQAINPPDVTLRDKQSPTKGSPIGVSPSLAESEKEFDKIQGKVYRLDFYDLHFRYNQPQGPNAHHYTSVQKHLLEEEVLRRADTLEGYGEARNVTTSLPQKAASLAAKMTTLELLQHQYYIQEGPGTYTYQKQAVSRELAKRPGSSDGFWGLDGAGGKSKLRGEFTAPSYTPLYLLSSETTARGTGLAESAGKE
ncbi:hypothetical protein ACN42_g11832, partial [Penicillium freii]